LENEHPIGTEVHVREVPEEDDRRVGAIWYSVKFDLRFLVA